MRRPIGWVDKAFPEGRREVKVNYHADEIKWKFKLKGEQDWDYDSQPREEDWLTLEKKIKQLIQRGHQYQRELQLAELRGKKN